MDCSVVEPEKKGKIFFVGNTAWSMYNFRLDVIKALMADHFEVVVLAPQDAWSEKIVKEGIQYIPIKMDNKGNSPIRDFKLFLTLFKLYKDNKPDIIFHYTIKPNIYGSIAAFLCRIKNIACVTGAGKIFISKNLLSVIVKGMFRFSFLFPQEVWFLNRDDIDMFTSSRLVKVSKCKLLPSEGINTTMFHDTSEKKRRGDNFCFLFLGRLLWDKGVGEYVDAARNIRSKFGSVEFKILGFSDVQNPSAITHQQLEEWVEDGLVNYLGIADDVRDIILESDCVVLPSYREGIPRSLLEAASLGIPVIATDVPGCREVVDDNINGYLCQPRNYVDLQKKMERIMDIGERERRLMGLAGRKKMVESFDMDIIIAQYKKVISLYNI